MTITLGPKRFVEMGLPAPDSVERLNERARRTFASVPSEQPAPIPPAIDMEPAEVLSKSVRVLDQWRALAGIAEAVDFFKARTFGDVQQHLSEIFTRAQLLTRIDVVRAFLDDPAVVESADGEPEWADPNTLFPVTLSPGFMRVVSSLVELCPIAELVTLSEDLAQPESGHRVQLSYDWLRAFTRRHGDGAQQTFHIVGQAYVDGRLSLDEVAHLLAMPRADTVARLEEFGYARDIAVIRLTAERRTSLLARIREDRIARGGEPVRDHSLVRRDVIATQRIEDIDARAWLQPGE